MNISEWIKKILEGLSPQCPPQPLPRQPSPEPRVVFTGSETSSGSQQGVSSPAPIPSAAPATPPNGRIDWNPRPPATKTTPITELQEAKKPTVVNIPTMSGPRIEWGGGNAAGISDSPISAGVEDAFDHSPLQPGERVAFCTQDKVAYHLSTWQFLQTQNQGRCVLCGNKNVISIITLPGILKPTASAPVIPRVQVLPGEQVISLEQVPNYIGRMVIVQDYVYEVYQTRNTGTIFVRFEPRQRGQPVYEGFKLVIFPDYQEAWAEQNIQIESYEQQYIRVRGVVQSHPTWGIEILVNSPRVIEIVDGPKKN